MVLLCFHELTDLMSCFICWLAGDSGRAFSGDCFFDRCYTEKIEKSKYTADMTTSDSGHNSKKNKVVDTL